MATLIVFSLQLVSCGKKETGMSSDGHKTDSIKATGTSEEGKAMSLLLRDFEQKSGKEHLGIADRIFERFFQRRAH